MLTEESFPSQVFTEAFVEQLVAALRVIPSREAGGFAAQRAPVLLQAQVTGGQRTVGRALACLDALGLVATVEGVLARTRTGNSVRKELVSSEASFPLARVVIRSGFVGDQIRALREVLVVADGRYRCSRHTARSVAPQLLGLLARLPDVVVAGEIHIGSDASQEIDSLWNEVLPSSRIDWADRQQQRKAVGDRAESYSMEFERTSRTGGSSDVTWVSRDDDSLGYDIEVASRPIRRIEVKGSSGPDVIFYLTAREYEVADRHAGAYEIQYWGTINIKADPRADYERLRAAGYPIRILDPIRGLQSSPWTMVADRHRVSVDGRIRAAALQHLLAQ